MPMAMKHSAMVLCLHRQWNFHTNVFLSCHSCGRREQVAKVLHALVARFQPPWFGICDILSMLFTAVLNHQLPKVAMLLPTE